MKAAPAEEMLNKLNVQNADKRYFNFFPHTLLITIFIKTKFKAISLKIKI